MEEKKKPFFKRFDNLVMGVILGGAIGSVLGLTLAPRKGKETRKIIKEKGEELVEKGKEVTDEFVREHKGIIDRAKEKATDTKEAILDAFRKKE